MSAIDNLIKGTSGQIQCFNLIRGIETAGLI